MENRLIKKYPAFESDIKKYRTEINMLNDIYKNIKKENKKTPPEEILKKYSKLIKYQEFQCKFPVVFFVLTISRMYCITAFIKYLNNYHSERIDNKERFMEVQNTYLTFFSSSILRDNNLNRDNFIMFYKEQCEDFFNVVEEVTNEKMKQKEIDEIRKKKNLELLKRKLSLV